MLAFRAITLTALFAGLASAAMVKAPRSHMAVAKRACPGKQTITTELDAFTEKILPELKPLNDGLTATEEELGKAIPLIKSLLTLLDENCL